MSEAGYSGTPLHKKLGYKPGFRVKIVNPPENYWQLLVDLPEDVYEEIKGPYDLIHFFSTSKSELESELPALKEEVKKQGGMLWISWPKKTAGVESDLDGNVVRSAGLMTGLVDAKVCAVDKTWSGLKFVSPNVLSAPISIVLVVIIRVATYLTHN